MPEGDSVYLAAKRMQQGLAGHRLTRTDFRVPQLATTDLAGRTVLAVVPRGKHMLTRLEGGLTLHTHFKMEGTWHLYRPRQRWNGPLWQVRVGLETAGGGRRGGGGGGGGGWGGRRGGGGGPPPRRGGGGGRPPPPPPICSGPSGT